MTRELASAINRADPAGRADVRDFAIQLLKDSVEPGEAPSADERSPRAGAVTPNPLALAIPALLVGGFLTFVFPPVGLVVVMMGVAACLVGLALAIGRTVSGRWRGHRTAR